MEILQPTLYIVLILLCLSLTVLFIYTIFLLKDIKNTVAEANKIIGAASKIVSSVVAPITALAGVMSGVSKGIHAIKSIGIFDEEDK